MTRTAVTTTAMPTVDAERTPCLHDCLAVGAVEVGLRQPQQQQPSASSSTASVQHHEDELHRLPLLLRLLSAARPISAVPSGWDHDLMKSGSNSAATNDEGKEKDDSTKKDNENDGNNSNTLDPLLEDAVARLEDRAALYSAAEGLESVACHLAPALCQRMGKLPPLRRRRRKTTTSHTTTAYDTTELQIVAENPRMPSNKRRRSHAKSRQQQRGGEGNNHNNDDDDSSDDEMGDDVDASDVASQPGTISTATKLSDDSQEVTVLKTLQEVARLTISHVDHHDKVPNLDDSVLNEAATGRTTNASDDLAATIACLLPYAPVLRHRHVAAAFSRSGVPQAAPILCRLGANAPAAVPALVAGVVAAEHTENRKNGDNDGGVNSGSRNTVTTKTTLAALRGLAALSPHQASRVGHVLRREDHYNRQQHHIGLRLELALTHDPVAAMLWLGQELSRPEQEGSRPFLLEDPDDRPRIVDKEDDGVTTTPTAATSPSSSFTCAPCLSLWSCLEGQPELRTAVLDCLARELSLVSTAPTARACLCLTAYAWVLYRVTLMLPDFSYSLTISLSTCVTALQTLWDERKESFATSDSSNPSSMLDRLHALLVVAVLTTCASLNFVEPGNDDQSKLTEATAALFQQVVLDGPVGSVSSDALVTSLLLSLRYENVNDLCERIETVLCAQSDGTSLPYWYKTDRTLSGRMALLCRSDAIMASHPRYNNDTLGVSDAELHHPYIVVQYCRATRVPLSERIAVAQTLLKRVLAQDVSAHVFLCSPEACLFLEEAVVLLEESTTRNVPLVSATQLERLSWKLEWQVFCPPDPNESLFFLQLLYSFLFAELQPQSPFQFDPRALPLKRMYRCLDSTAIPFYSNNLVCLRLKKYLGHFTEVLSLPMSTSLSYTDTKSNQVASLHEHKTNLSNVIKKSIVEPDMDPDGRLAEQAFLVAQAYLSEADLSTITVRALFARPSSPLLFLTYPVLCRDPLNVLKCPLRIWTRPGTRRIALMVLSSLLDINETLAERQTQSSENVQEEYLASRNQTVVRSLLALACAGHTGHCGMTRGLIRRMIGRQRGLLSLLLRQKLSESEIDWIVEFVPESIHDMEHIQGLLDDRTSLSAAQRLVAADAILRIVISHGHHESAAVERAVYAALSQLVSCFFLIVGPTGIPVSLKMGEGTNEDASQIARQAAFRILSAAPNIRSYRTRLRNEFIMTLQKFAGLCKGEAIVGTLSTAIANRQKSFLKELLDATIRSMEALGTSI